MRGPTLSPVASLCLAWVPSQAGNVPDSQQRQYTPFLPASRTCQDVNVESPHTEMSPSKTSERHNLFDTEQFIPVLVHHFAYCVLTSLLTTLGESRSMRPLIFPGPSTSSAMARAELRAAWRGRGAKAEAEAQRERTAMDFMM